MTNEELAEIEKACAEAKASSDLRFTAPWVFMAVPALLAEVKRLREENRKLNDWVLTNVLGSDASFVCPEHVRQAAEDILRGPT